MFQDCDGAFVLLSLAALDELLETIERPGAERIAVVLPPLTYEEPYATLGPRGALDATWREWIAIVKE